MLNDDSVPFCMLNLVLVYGQLPLGTSICDWSFYGPTLNSGDFGLTIELYCWHESVSEKATSLDSAFFHP